MRKVISAAIFSGLSLCSFDFPVMAQMIAATPPPAPFNSQPPPSPPSAVANSTAVVAAPTPTDVPSPIRMLYIMDYTGPRLGSGLNFNTTQAAGGAETTANMFHDLRIGYAINDSSVIGVRGQVVQNLQTDPVNNPQTFVTQDLRVYGTWKAMIDTPDIQMDGVLDVFFPNSTSSQNAGIITYLNIKNNWTFKTALRNWTFKALTILTPVFYNNPTGNDDLYLQLIPMVWLDITTETQIYFELDLATNHLYSASFFDYSSQGTTNSFTLGPLFSLGAHFTAYPALRFYTNEMDFKTSTLYFEFTASL